jgi:hypothetical protein
MIEFPRAADGFKFQADRKLGELLNELRIAFPMDSNHANEA